MFVRPYYQPLKERIEESKKFIQIVMGPRQVGKNPCKTAIEVKSNNDVGNAGLALFRERFDPQAAFVVG